MPKSGRAVADAAKASTEPRARHLYDPASVEPYKLSRNKIELFVDCPRCFYLDRRLGISRPSSPAYTLNMAVDTLLKKEFDIARAKGEAHALMLENGIDALPLRHPALEEWRSVRTGVHCVHPQTNFHVFGAVDDVWVNPVGQLNVVDYKATSTAVGVQVSDVMRPSYCRQAEVYQWLFRQNGFAVSDTAYFVYMNADKGRESLDGRLEFTARVIPYRGSTDWVDEALAEVKLCLHRKSPPAESLGCEWCAYRSAAGLAGA